MIIDVHTHTFPRLGTPCGDDPPEVQLKHVQHHTYLHIQGWRRKSDGQRQSPDRKLLCDGVNKGISGMYEVNFRFGKYGRVEFTYDGEEYWLQWMPPSLQQMECPPEFMIASMDYVGIDKAVLCGCHGYGELNSYTSECVRRYPDRFIGLAEIREWKAYQPEEITRLTRAVEELGLRGLHFLVESLFMTDFQDDWTSPKFDPLWKEVQRLRIPIFWDIYSWNWVDWQKESRKLTEWAQRHPDIPSLVTHGIPVKFMPRDQHHVEVPQVFWDLYRCPNIYVEVHLPVVMGGQYEYPYLVACKLLQELHQELGPHKLVWGSDMPAAERVATYRQSLGYLKGCDFFTEEEYGLLVGGNAARLLSL